MTPKGEWFKSYNEFSCPTMVYVRDGNTKVRSNWHWKSFNQIKIRPNNRNIRCWTCRTCQKNYYCWANQPKMVLSSNLQKDECVVTTQQLGQILHIHIDCMK
jgi:hypothetical protein